MRLDSYIRKNKAFNNLNLESIMVAIGNQEYQSLVDYKPYAGTSVFPMRVVEAEDVFIKVAPEYASRKTFTLRELMDVNRSIEYILLIDDDVCRSINHDDCTGYDDWQVIAFVNNMAFIQEYTI